LTPVVFVWLGIFIASASSGLRSCLAMTAACAQSKSVRSPEGGQSEACPPFLSTRTVKMVGTLCFAHPTRKKPDATIASGFQYFLYATCAYFRFAIST
jgi:hypothetical protein